MLIFYFSNTGGNIYVLLVTVNFFVNKWLFIVFGSLRPAILSAICFSFLSLATSKFLLTHNCCFILNRLLFFIESATKETTCLLQKLSRIHLEQTIVERAYQLVLEQEHH